MILPEILLDEFIPVFDHKKRKTVLHVIYILLFLCWHMTPLRLIDSLVLYKALVTLEICMQLYFT